MSEVLTPSEALSVRALGTAIGRRVEALRAEVRVWAPSDACKAQTMRLLNELEDIARKMEDA